MAFIKSSDLLKSATTFYAFLLCLLFVAFGLIWLDMFYGLNPIEKDLAKESDSSPLLVCYYTFNLTDLPPEGVDANLCTHLIVGFAGIDSKNFTVALSDSDQDLLWRLKNRTSHSSALLLLSVGGGGQSNFGVMCKNHKNRKIFIHSLMTMIKTFGLDGVDIDWEWPVIDGGITQKVQFIQLLGEIRTEFDRHRRKYMLSAAVSAAESIVTAAYYVRHLAEHVDFVNIMCYDYHFFTRLYPITDYNSPLYPNSGDVGGALQDFNVNYTINLWISLGMPARQIVLGIPLYGHSFKLRNLASHGRHAPAVGFGLGDQGFITYPEVCQFISGPFSSVVHDKEAMVPYAYDFDNWISFEDAGSLEEKVRFARRMNLRGVMVYSLNTDDHSAKCSSVTYPLLKIVQSSLNYPGKL